MTSSDPLILAFVLAFLVSGPLSPRNLTWFISLNCWVDAHLPQLQDPLSHPLGGDGKGVGKNQDI